MGDFITCCIFFIEIIIFIIIDYKRYGSLINPISFISIPFACIFLLCIFFNSRLNFVDFYISSLWVWIIGLFFFWITGNISTILIKRENLKKSSKVNNYLPIIIFVFCAFLSTLKINSLGSNFDFGSKELGVEMGMGGIMGRASNILLIMFPFVTTSNLKKIPKLCVLILLCVLLMSLGSKTWILNAIVASFILLMVEKKIKFTRYSIFIILISIFILLFAFFFLYYKLNTNIEDNEALFVFVYRHFYFYLTSGILPLGLFYKIGSFDVINEFQLPFINILEIWLGKQVSSGHSPLWYTTDISLGTQSNVFTFFGTLFVESSFWGFLFYSSFFGFWCYLIFAIARVKANIYINIINVYNLSILFFGWYNCSFAILRIWEVTVYCLIFYYVTKKNTYENRIMGNISSSNWRGNDSCL